MSALDDRLDEVRDVYRRQGVGGGRVGFGRSAALLIVDLQQIYTRGRRSTGLEAVEATRVLLDEARRCGVPVFFTYVGYEPGSVDTGTWGVKCPGLAEDVRGTTACEIDPLVEPVAGEEVLEKRAPSAFFDTGLAGVLRDRGVDTVVVCGTSTSGCVRASVIDGVSHGFRVLVPRECVSDRSAPSHEIALFDIDAKYGDVISLQAALGGLRSLAGRERG